MTETRQPWQPNPRWADPLIAALACLCLLAVALGFLGRAQAARRPAEGATLQGRLMEAALGAPGLPGSPRRGRDWEQVQHQLREPWDRALVAVLEAELDTPPPDRLALLRVAAPAGAEGQAFRTACEAAYGAGPLPTPAAWSQARRQLGGGFAADLLEARLADREGRGEALRSQARSALLTRLLGLGAGVALLVVLGGVGLVTLLTLWARRGEPRPTPLPAWGLSSRAAALVLLLWFLGFNLVGGLVATLLRPWPALRWVAIPLGTTLHAAWGVALLLKAEGLGFRALWRRVAPTRPGKDLAWGGAFLGLAVLLVFAVAAIWGLLVHPQQAPQRDLQALLRSASGLGPGLLLLLAVAGIAPFFEELLFRGFLLPVMAQRRGFTAAVIVTALLFGAIHMEPMGLPVLSTLGLTLGLALRHTGSLRAPILVHACWNAGQFLLMRALS
jgi:membrane protease YdiL (CAAX protease family)